MKFRTFATKKVTSKRKNIKWSEDYFKWQRFYRMSYRDVKTRLDAKYPNLYMTRAEVNRETHGCAERINNNEGRGYLTCDVAKYILGREKKLSKSEIIAEYTKKLNAVWNTCNIKIKGEK